MEETTLDFESLVLGKKKTPSAPTSPSAIPALQPRPLQAPLTNSRPTTPGNLMTPLQPTTSTSPPPPSQTNFFQPLKPTPYTGPPTSNMSSILQPTPATGHFSPPPQSANSAFNINNPWQSNPSFPTIAPPPNKPTTPVVPGFTAQNNPGAGGLDKYQSLL